MKKIIVIIKEILIKIIKKAGEYWFSLIFAFIATLLLCVGLFTREELGTLFISFGGSIYGAALGPVFADIANESKKRMTEK